MCRVLSTWLAVLLTACAVSTPSQSTTPTTTTSVRTVDWATVAYPRLDLRAGDEVGAPQYVDLTGDGLEDAVIEGLAITPGGNSYTTYIFVFTVPRDAASPVLLATLVGGDRADGAIRLTGIDAEGLHLARAVLGPDDAMCCPSTEQHERWVWNGSELNEDHTQRRVVPTEP